MAMKFINQWQYEPLKGEWNDEASLTEPNQTYSLREILRRSSVGMDVTSTMSRHADYDDNPDVDDFVAPHGMDIAEAADMFKNSVDEYNEEMKKQQEEKKKTSE